VYFLSPSKSLCNMLLVLEDSKSPCIFCHFENGSHCESNPPGKSMHHDQNQELQGSWNNNFVQMTWGTKIGAFKLDQTENQPQAKRRNKKYKLVRSWLTAPPFQGTKVGFVLDCRTCLTTMRVGRYQRSETTIRQVEPDIATTIMLTRGGMMLYPEARHPQSFLFSP